jgi:hypothetical protein
MRHIRLVSFEDKPTGELGLGIKGHTHDERLFSDREGALLAHDIVEHQNGIAAIGCPADELEAIGAIWQVRGRHGTLLNHNHHPRCIYESIAYDVVTCADEVTGEYNRWWPALGQYRTRPHDYDEDFMEILAKARPMIVEQNADCERDDWPLDAFMENALHLMRMGFNKAKRRFGMHCLGADTYCAIRDAIRPQAKHLEFAGQEFRLSYGDGRAYCQEVYDEAW